MKLVGAYNTTEAAIHGRAFNPYLGVSIKNKYFTEQALYEYARWGAAHCDQKFAILIVDILQRINNSVLEGIPPMKALDKTFRQSDVIVQHCENALAALPPAAREKIVILEWADIITDQYSAQCEAVFNLFTSNPAFRDYILQHVRNSLGGIVNRLKETDIETLCSYLLYELPELFNGFTCGGVHFNLCVYPGAFYTLIETLVTADYLDGLRQLLLPNGPIAHAAMFVDDGGF